MVVITVEKIPEGLGWLRLWRLSAGFVARSARYSRLPPAMNHFNVFTHNTHISIKKNRIGHAGPTSCTCVFRSTPSTNVVEGTL